MAVTVQNYSIAWSDRLIHRIERLLRDIHAAVGVWYDKNAYPRRVVLRALKSSEGYTSPGTKSKDSNPTEKTSDLTSHSADGDTLDAISPAGSFMLRTCVHRTPYEENHSMTGIGVDVVLTIPEQICSEEDLREGRYLACRQAFLEEVLQHLKGVQKRAEAVGKEGRRRSNADEDTAEEEEEEDIKERTKGSSSTVEEEEDVKRSHNKTYHSEFKFLENIPKHFGRMEISVIPIHECYGCQEKKIIRLRWRRKAHHAANRGTASTLDPLDAGSTVEEVDTAEGSPTPSSMDPSSLLETPYVDVHFRPVTHSARVSGAKVVHKHPLYSYMVLEDYWMPVFLERLHRLCVNSPGLRRTIVLLKCWALHLGLHAPSSGHSEGLNGFLIAAMVLYLLEEEGVLHTGMTEETAARAVLVYISGGGFTKPSLLTTNKTSVKLPTPEEKGEVATMRFSGDAFNLLFRSSTPFFKFVVERAAQESLRYSKLSELFLEVPFQPLAFRYDLSLSLQHCAPPKHWPAHQPSESRSFLDVSTLPTDNGEEETKASSRDCMGSHRHTYFPPLVSWAHHIRQLVFTALQSRVVDVSVWMSGYSTLQLIVYLTSTADGRRRLTRGPPVEDEAAVAAFDAFWGKDKTSTRQFPDGAVYRCVLWDVGEDSSVEQVTQRIVSYALQKHVTYEDVATSSSFLSSVVSKEQAMIRNGNKEVQVNVLLGGLGEFLCERVGGGEWKDVQPAVKKPLWEACKSVREMIAHLPDTALPCKILDFDFISASERCTEVFPIRPHLALTSSSHTRLAIDRLKGNCSENAEEKKENNESGVSQHQVPKDSRAISSSPPLSYFTTKGTIEPIHCVLTIDDRNRIPDNLEAIQLMKAAIGAQLSKALQRLYGTPSEDKEDITDKEKTESKTIKKSGVDSRNRRRESTAREVGGRAPEAHSPSASAFPIYASCHPHGVDIICQGFFFRVYVAHYREVSLLRALQMPSQADIIEQKMFWTVQHAKLIRSIVYGHPSYSSAVRLAKRWISAMMLYEFVLPEAVELLVAHAYLKSHEAGYRHGSGSSNINNRHIDSLTSPPRTALAGFMRFIELLATHNWEKPLVLPTTDDPTFGTHETEMGASHASEGGKHHAGASTSAAAHALWREQQQKSRNGTSTAMFIAAPYAPTLSPFTISTPRKMVLHRLVALAKAAFFLLLHHAQHPSTSPPPSIGGKLHNPTSVANSALLPLSIKDHESDSAEAALFRCSLLAFDIALCFHSHAVLHHDRATTVPYASEDGPGEEVERIWHLDELALEERKQYVGRRVERDPAGQTVRLIRRALRDKAMAFYDALAPSRAVFLVALQATPPSAKDMTELAKEAIEAGSGGVLPTPILYLASSPLSLRKNSSRAFSQTNNRVVTVKSDGKAKHHLPIPPSSTGKKKTQERKTSKEKKRGNEVVKDSRKNEKGKEMIKRKHSRGMDSESSQKGKVSSSRVKQERQKEIRTEDEGNHEQKRKRAR